MGPTSTSTPNKTGGGLSPLSSSNDSRHFMTPFKMGLYGSLSYPSGTGMCHGSITPMTSVAGSQQVTSSVWQPTGSFSPLPPQAMDTLSAERAIEIYQLAAECQALSSKLTKQFQNLSGLEAMHHMAAQAAAHETSMWDAWPTAPPLVSPQPPKQARNVSHACAGSMLRPTRHGKMPTKLSSPIC